MFVEYTTTVDVRLSLVENRLDRVRASLEEWADIAYRDGEDLMAKVGPMSSVSRRVQLVIGVAEIYSGGLVYPISWTVNGAAMLFPSLEADLWLTSLGPHQTRLTLKGNYRPPLGTLGRIADRALLGRVAEATVADWIDRLATAVNEQTVS